MIDEMKSIVKEVWEHIGIGKIPNVATKKGGYTATYSPSTHTITFRMNSWNKMRELSMKRLLVIHECYHAAGHGHSVNNGIYLSSFDLLSLAFYNQIWGEDDCIKKARYVLEVYCKEYLKYVKELRR